MLLCVLCCAVGCIRVYLVGTVSYSSCIDIFIDTGTGTGTDTDTDTEY
jgi:hypothetical protein